VVELSLHRPWVQSTPQYTHTPNYKIINSDYEIIHTYYEKSMEFLKKLKTELVKVVVIPAPRKLT
jgi:hypothetical protein